jgi:hypothetical protein
MASSASNPDQENLSLLGPRESGSVIITVHNLLYGSGLGSLPTSSLVSVERTEINGCKLNFKTHFYLLDRDL